ncbi:c-type cytochrome [Novosphingobium mangrovi (ex Hu et al. 2023)]|uniref:C-type cytochrome n=1 Tax=Novosphingobium mangrovi (ex Hu et al. 2023) TaxID=2930094 RepID=A0ABT0ADL7_9SPHN|nr:c-type cytochrome [Novosphingobium mangrovi (ex Hu et al. 2023)]MCJ1961296.1 c-type cytochrome [Novosphingobium mangrovi (ex Hu et al. 2023)]
MRTSFMIAAGLLTGLSLPAEAQDAAAGRKVFTGSCAVCHGTKPGEKKMGPSLFGVVGRKAGSAEGFRFSPALAKDGRSWNPKSLDAFLANPRKEVPGTRMAYAGLRNAEQRKALVAYLATLK